MAMTNPMYDVAYDRMNFNDEPKEQRHPKYITERDYVYHLNQDDKGFLVCRRDVNGEPVKSPRKLRSICLNRLVCDGTLLPRLNSQLLPTNVYPLLLTEAIFLREPQSIEWIISTWPMRVLRVYDVIPPEDSLEDDYFTLPFEGNEEVTLVDCFVLGLLKLKPESNLKLVDFTRFDKDRKLCKELCRLPILWTKPEERTVEKIHTYMSETLEVTKDKVQCFLNRISAVYSNIDSEFLHGNEIEPITILVDLHVNIDDVPIGLSLQRYSPFKFACYRLWMKSIPDVEIPINCLGRVLDTNIITHLEYEDPMLSSDESKLNSLIEALHCLPNIRALSLPDCVNVTTNQSLADDLNAALKDLKHLHRLNLSYCNLRGRLGVILGGLHQRFIYLNLKDCRLTEEDVFFLVNWRNLAGLKELNLSCNNLQLLDQVVIVMLEKMPIITCLSVSFCSLSVTSQVLIARECKECSRLKVLCMQGYTPPSTDDIVELLTICSQIRTLQKAVLFPEAYAFPGNIEQEREFNKYQTMVFSYAYLEYKGRTDVQLE